MKTFYLAGPMTGYPKFNFPLFEAAAKWLREAGLTITSPAELDDKPVRDAAMVSEKGESGEHEAVGWTHGDLLARDVKIIADRCQGIILLPHWEKSKGAKLEAFVGLLYGLEFKTLGVLTAPNGGIRGFHLMPGSRDGVLAEIYGALR